MSISPRQLGMWKWREAGLADPFTDVHGSGLLTFCQIFLYFSSLKHWVKNDISITTDFTKSLAPMTNSLLMSQKTTPFLAPRESLFKIISSILIIIIVIIIVACREASGTRHPLDLNIEIGIQANAFSSKLQQRHPTKELAQTSICLCTIIIVSYCSTKRRMPSSQTPSVANRD